MIAVDFPERNFVFKKPSDMTDEQCSDLCVWRGGAKIEDTEDTIPVIMSCWKLSVEDLEEIRKTGIVWLSITGHGMPPVALFTENPFSK